MRLLKIFTCLGGCVLFTPPAWSSFALTEFRSLERAPALNLACAADNRARIRHDIVQWLWRNGWSTSPHFNEVALETLPDFFRLIGRPQVAEDVEAKLRFTKRHCQAAQ